MSLESVSMLKLIEHGFLLKSSLSARNMASDSASLVYTCSARCILSSFHRVVLAAVVAGGFFQQQLQCFRAQVLRLFVASTHDSASLCAVHRDAPSSTSSARFKFRGRWPTPSAFRSAMSNSV